MNNVNTVPAIIWNTKIQTIFGHIDQDKVLIYQFEEGLVGFERFVHFAVAPFPQADLFDDFFILQSLEQDSLCFILKKLKLATSGALFFDKVSAELRYILKDIKECSWL